MAATAQCHLLSRLLPIQEHNLCPCSQIPFPSIWPVAPLTFSAGRYIQPNHRNTQSSRTRPLAATTSFLGQSLDTQRASQHPDSQKRGPALTCSLPDFLAASPWHINSEKGSGFEAKLRRRSLETRKVGRSVRVQAAKVEAAVDERKAEWGPELESWLAESGLPEQVA
jgi:hypothetical protein